MKIGDHVRVKITDWTTEGRGVARSEGRVLFVEGALPGDVCEVEVRLIKKNFVRARTLRILSDSPDRRISSAEEQEDDGADLYALRPEAQRRWKKDYIEQSMRRIGGLETDCEFVPMPDTGYRNKVLFRLNEKGQLCRLRRRSKERIAVFRDPLVVPALQSTIAHWNDAVAATLVQQNQEDAVRAVQLRVNSAGHLMVSLILRPVVPQRRRQIFDVLHPLLQPEVLCACETAREGDVALQNPLYFATNQRMLSETICGLQLSLSPASFFQVNRDSVEMLYQIALAFFSEGTGKTILDLYCGTGVTSLLLAKRGARVIGVEVEPSAVRDAKKNARRNAVQGAEFRCARVEQILPQLLEESKATEILLDPPRAGLHKKAVEALCASGAQRIVYISCNPATLARDCGRLCESGFVVKSLVGVDQFVNTSNVETVCLLTRNQ
uniref:23S rRNA (uracil(1939)-C(5))-methyltransferase RlmD n=1 Tax=Ndongobacter massiliensis TaxID=1871025 RepID=UPI000931E583|nr:23S rRNA (uracil(1939)-C(5))-methyltransferase RlmD [Ndongobacter massiliensis]